MILAKNDKTRGKQNKITKETEIKNKYNYTASI